MGLLRNAPPEYDQSRSLEENFGRFFDWGSSLRNPSRLIKNVESPRVVRHPLGFLAVSLSQRPTYAGDITVGGIARANIFPPGVEVRDDIHCHGFDFFSGVAQGAMINRLLPEGEGFVGYESRSDINGVNHVTRATGAVIGIPRSEDHPLVAGDTYAMRAREGFHSLLVAECTVTIFCKTPTRTGGRGSSLMLLPPDAPSPVEHY